MSLYRSIKYGTNIAPSTINRSNIIEDTQLKRKYIQLHKNNALISCNNNA